MAWLWKFSVAFLLAFSLGVGAQPRPFTKRKIAVGTRSFEVDIASSPDQHERGLMFRKSLSNDEGMLFIFEDEAPRSFWMKNTLIDLSIGYFNKKGVLIDIQEMKTGKGIPDLQLPSYPSAGPAMYALEMRKGWFDEHKIKLGTKLVLKH